MNGMRRAALALGATPFAWAGPPLPMSPPYQESPLWPQPAPGPVPPRDSTPHTCPDQARDDTAAEVVDAANRQRARAGC
ncbi:hypothetical protein ACIQXA_10685 [Streptomyces massasporeus]|uniref:hypothetical protein n=1 Tax=Streptomyces massasporeus TaxID=67324 RepID=UPI0037F5B01E